jgi:hypothetical protein
MNKVKSKEAPAPKFKFDFNAIENHCTKKLLLWRDKGSNV